MSDYEFRCPDCKKVNCIHSTGEVPKPTETVECISCGRISVVQDKFETLTVIITGKKITPSKIDALSQNQEQEKKQ